MKTHKWSDIRRKRTPAEEKAIDTKKAALRAEMLLADLRKARRLTQAAMAQMMECPQGEISKIEKRSDVYVSTLSKFLEAMNGQLVLVARFPEGDVPVRLYDEEDDRAAAHA